MKAATILELQLSHQLSYARACPRPYHSSFLSSPLPGKHVARRIPLPPGKSNQSPEKPVRHSPITPHCLKKFKSIKWRQINVIWKRSPPPLAVGLQQTLFEVFSHIISLFTQNYCLNLVSMRREQGIWYTWFWFDHQTYLNVFLMWPSDIFECYSILFQIPTGPFAFSTDKNVKYTCVQDPNLKSLS